MYKRQGQNTVLVCVTVEFLFLCNVSAKIRQIPILLSRLRLALDCFERRPSRIVRRLSIPHGDTRLPQRTQNGL